MGLDMPFPWEMPSAERIAWIKARRERTDAIRRGLAEIPMGFFTVKEFYSLLRFMNCTDFNLFEENDLEKLELKISEFAGKSTANRIRNVFCLSCGANIKDDSDHRC